MNAIQVIKIGGAEDIDVDAVCANVARLWQAGERFVLVHGGSAPATQLGEALGHPPRFVTSPSGHTSRLTDARTLEIFLMATAAFNRRIVTTLAALGVSALGLSGVDGGLLRAERKRAIRVVENGRTRVIRDDLTGKPISANGELLQQLLAAGHLPVVAPVGLSEEHQALNVDGDRAAAVIAGSVDARTLLLLTAVPGVMRAFPDESTVIEHVPAEGFDEVLELAEGRMKKKVLGAREALALGVQSAVIARAGGDAPVTSALAGRGTVFGAALTPVTQETA